MRGSLNRIKALCERAVPGTYVEIAHVDLHYKPEEIMLSRIFLSSLVLALSVPVLSQTPAEKKRLGAVRFTTSRDPAGYPAFDRAVALLHSFEMHPNGETRSWRSMYEPDRHGFPPLWVSTLSGGETPGSP